MHYKDECHRSQVKWVCRYKVNICMINMSHCLVNDSAAAIVKTDKQSLWCIFFKSAWLVMQTNWLKCKQTKTFGRTKPWVWSPSRVSTASKPSKLHSHYLLCNLLQSSCNYCKRHIKSNKRNMNTITSGYNA